MSKVSNYIWGMLGKLLPQGINLITSFVLAHFLTPDDFGQIGVLLVFSTVAGTLMEAGLGGSLVKEKIITDIDCSTIFVYNIVISTIFYILIFCCSGLIESFFNISGLSTVCRLLCLVFVINSFGQIALTLLYRELRFKTLCINNAVGAFCASITAIAMAMNGCGVYALVAQLVSQQIIVVCLNWYFSKYQLSFKFSFKSFRRLFSFGFYTTVSNIIESIYENLITSVIGKYLGVKPAGYLTQAKRLETASCNVFVSTINNVSFPMLVKVNDCKKVFINEAERLMKVALLLSLPLIFSIAIYSEEIIRLTLGKEWILAAPYLRILMFAGVFMIGESITRNFLKSLLFVKTLFIITIIKRIIGLGLIIGCVLYEPNYVLYAYMGGSIIGFFANWIVYVKIMGLSLMGEIKKIVVLQISPLCVYILLYFANAYSHGQILFNIIFCIIVLSVYYLVIMPAYKINVLRIIKMK